MLRDDVIEAVAAGRFAIHAVRHVDDAVELLTGLAAGDPTQPHADTVNGRIAMRLQEYARLRRGEARVTRRQRVVQIRRIADGEGKA
jgi:hypothetical protein